MISRASRLISASDALGVLVPAALARLETSMTEQQAMRIEARARDHSPTLSPPDPSLRDNVVTARSYGPCAVGGHRRRGLLLESPPGVASIIIASRVDISSAMAARSVSLAALSMVVTG